MTPSNEIDVELLRGLVRKSRERQKLSLRMAAKESGVSFPTLQRVETGQLPSAGVLVKLVDWLGIGIDDLRVVGPERLLERNERVEAEFGNPVAGEIVAPNSDVRFWTYEAGVSCPAPA